MPETMELIKILVGIATISGIITAGAVYYTRRSLDRAQHTNSKSIDEIKNTVINNSKETRVDYQNLIGHIDERIDKIYNSLEANSTELKDYVAKEVSALKAKDDDLDIKVEHSKDKVHGVSEELLKFKLEASEKYVTKNNNNN
jgi:hypothetical protein